MIWSWLLCQLRIWPACEPCPSQRLTRISSYGRLRSTFGVYFQTQRMGKPGAIHFNWSSAAMHSSQIKLMCVLCAALLTPPCRFDGAEAAHSIILSTSQACPTQQHHKATPPLT